MRIIKVVTEILHVLCIATANKPGTIEEENEEELNNSFDAAQNFIRNIIENPDIVEYNLVTDIFGNELRKSKMIDDYVKNAKKNLRRKIERNISYVNFITMLDASFIFILIRTKKLISILLRCFWRTNSS